jgi:hypothetical protein
MAEIKGCENCKYGEITANNEYPCLNCDENYSLWESYISPAIDELSNVEKLAENYNYVAFINHNK